MRRNVERLNAVRAKLRQCPKCEGQGFVEWGSPSGCSVRGARCSCPIGKHDDTLSSVAVARVFKRLSPIFGF